MDRDIQTIMNKTFDEVPEDVTLALELDEWPEE